MRISRIVVPILAASLFSTSALAVQGSKFSATLSKTALLNESTGYSGTIMESMIHTSNKKELLIGVSLETGLYTQTEVKSKGGKEDTASATAGIKVTVYIDGEEVKAEPGTIIFNEREQVLSAELGGVLEDCTDDDGSNTITLDECTLTDEEINLIQDTMSAHHFNFVAPDLYSGDHTITVKAEIYTDTDSGDGSAYATGMVGKGSLTVESVQAINQDGGIYVLE